MYQKVKFNKGTQPRLQQGPLAPLTQDDVNHNQNVDKQQYTVEPAEVIDIILNAEHGEYDKTIPDPEEQIGFIRVRRLFSDQNIEDENTLPWAVPLTRNQKQYPLKHEVVLTSTYLNKQSVGAPDTEQMYYHDIINMWGSVHHNALPFITIPKPNSESTLKDKIAEYKEVGYGNPNIEGDEDDTVFGDTFVEQARIRPIQPYEGDTTMEGRFGHSIRFGSAVKSIPENTWSDPSTDDPAEPIRIIRNGQDQDLEAGGEHVVEHPDLEAASIWMTKGQTVPLTFGSTKTDALSFTAGTNTVGEDLTAPTTDNLIDEDGERQGQIVLTANRLIFNSREAGVFIFGGGPGIGLTTENDMTFDAGNEFLVDTPSVYLNATEKFELECPLIYIGVEQDSAQGGSPTVGSTEGHPFVLGDEDDTWKATLCDIIDAMLTTLQSEIHPTPVGPSGPPIQAPQYASQQSDLATLKSKIPDQYSKTVFGQP